MKKLILTAALVAALYFGVSQPDPLRRLVDSVATEVHSDPSEVLGSAFREQKSGIQVTGEGTVTKLLADDNQGRRHQRFILALPSGQTLLIAHNIDLAPRITWLKTGDTVAFHGVYEWNPEGGVIHWTHRDPSGRHEAGWLKHAGLTYH